MKHSTVEAERAAAFLEPVRAAIDNAELCMLSDFNRSDAMFQFRKATLSLMVAARNLEFARDTLREACLHLEMEIDNASTAGRIPAGTSVVPESEAGSDSLSATAASPAER